ncbi:MAG: DNA-processing protein DprA [Candidatus Pacebacteria bacterium]|nr:DNA-processing protein DprA [Candidatus Paceibacterota bacterium]
MLKLKKHINMEEIKKLQKEDWPENILEMADLPKQLHYRGQKPDWGSIFLTVVGSRKYSQYGKEVCQKLIEGLKGYDITIVSGLALGIDAIAHKTALENNLKTIAFPGSGLDENFIYPKSNFALAKGILKAGGTLLSEYEHKQEATPWTFPQRNRIMAGLSRATLVIEATEKSGTLITARLALEYNREVCAVPTSIFSFYGKGSNKLLHQGATPITSSQDLLQVLGFDLENQEAQLKIKFDDCSKEEKLILENLKEPKSRDELIQNLKMPVNQVNILLSSMEIKGLILESLGKIQIKD